MAKKVTSVRLTGGAGFGFEDKVAAFFLAKLLSGRPVSLPHPAQVVRLDWQVRDRGWLLDDLVVSLIRDEIPISLSLSIKSHRQVTKKGFPKEFVHAAWEQWLGPFSTPFQKEQDLLGLVTGELAGTVKTAWESMLSEALQGDPARTTKRFTTGGQSNSIVRDLFQSLRRPAGLGNEEDEIFTGQLIRRIRLFHFDFLSSHSSDLANAVEMCQSIVAGSSIATAEQLWQKLIGIAAERRIAGGYIDSPGIYEELRDFSLQNRPIQRDQWRRVQLYSDSNTSNVSDSIGQKISLLRFDDLLLLQERIVPGNRLLVIGEPGAGKSSLVKRAVWAFRNSDRLIWIDSGSLDPHGLQALFDGNLHTWDDLIKESPCIPSVLVLDSVDRFASQAENRVRMIVEPLLTRGDWCIIATARREGEVEARRRLATIGLGASVETVTLSLPTIVDVAAALRIFPLIEPFTSRVEFHEFLRNLKILDWIAISSEIQPDLNLSGWAGIQDLIGWIWSAWTGAEQDKYARSSLLKKLAAKEAEGLAAGVGISQLEGPEHHTLQALVLQELVRVRHERVSFSHDLVGDWARLHTLIEKEPGGLEIADLARLPLWHSAIRLYGQWLVERERDVDRSWLHLFKVLPRNIDHAAVARGLLLESVIRATNADALLEQLWPTLRDAQGDLLNQLLRRFMFSGTIPCPELVKLAKSRDLDPLDLEIELKFRVPYRQLWGPVLQFIARHVDEVAHLARETAAELCCMWLRSVPKDWPWRQEAATVALRIAREVQAIRAEGDWRKQEESQSTYEAVLCAAPDRLHDVVTILLEVAQRKRVSATAARRAKERREATLNLEEGSAEWLPIPHFSRGRLRKPFPDGPRRRVDESLQRAVLNTGALNALVEVAPAKAKEVLLACCLESPRYEYDGGLRGAFSRLGTVLWYDWNPPMYFRGPFLQFLNAAPRHGLDMVIRLVNQVTLNWKKEQKGLGRQVHLGKKVSGERLDLWIDDDLVEWVGNAQVYAWYRDLLINSEILVSALMALEMWLYQKVDLGETLEGELRQIFKSSKSVAFLGVLVGVARKNPRLLEGPLRPLLGIWRLYGWDDHLVVHDRGWRIGLMSWARWGESAFNLARDWHAMPHRQIRFMDCAIRLLFTSSIVWEEFEAIRRNWQKELDDLSDPSDKEELELLLARFDPSNYHTEAVENGTMLFFGWPERLQEKMSQESSASELAMSLLTFPFQCRQMLDRETPVSSEGARDLWDKIQYFSTSKEQIEEIAKAEGDTILPARRFDSIMGGIAVLAFLSQGWLEESQDRVDWCAKQLHEVIETAHLVTAPIPPDSISSDRWHDFLGECSVAWLAPETENAFARHMVAQSLSSYWHSTTALTMKAGFRLRKVLGTTFIQMENFSILWAGLCGVSTSGSAWFQRWHRRMIRAFVSGTIPSHPMDWQRIASLARRGRFLTQGRKHLNEMGERQFPRAVRNRRRMQVSRVEPELDLKVIQSAFDWLPDLSASTSREEQEAWIKLHSELLGVSLSMFSWLDVEESSEGLGAPYDYDYWVLGLVAGIIPQLPDARSRESFWKPIMGLGSAGHYWVEAFLVRWFSKGTKAASSVDAFFECWSELIAYALSSPDWTPLQGQGRFHLRGLWVHLMGLGMGAAEIRGEEYAVGMGRLVSLFERWGERWLDSPRALLHFAHFLRAPSARSLLWPGLSWIHQHVVELSSRDWSSEKDLEGNLVEVLHVAWRQLRDTIISDKELREIFLSLLTILIRRESGPALELRERVIRSIDNSSE